MDSSPLQGFVPPYDLLRKNPHFFGIVREGRDARDEADHEHDEFDSFVVEIPAVTDPAELARRVEAAAEKENVLRVKGFVEVGGKPMRLLVQAVGPRVNHYYDRAWTAADERRSRLVVIGLKGIDRAAIEQILAG